MKAIDRLITRHRRHHIYKMFRDPLRKAVGPVFVLFSSIDYLYLPGDWVKATCLRLLWFGLVLIVFRLLVKSSRARKHSDALAGIILILACWIVDWMIACSGGYDSLYITGLILVNVTGIQIIGFPRRQSLLVNLFSFGPTILIIWTTGGLENWKASLIQSAFLVGMTLLTWFYTSSGDDEISNWASRQKQINDEVQRLQKTEMLKKHFPAFLRKQMESGAVKLPMKQPLAAAVVGFADICASTSIANEVDLATDWELKELFLKAAAKRATENNLIILDKNGDGCFFLANFQGENIWPINVVAFFENLLADFHSIKSQLKLGHLADETGIKFGLSMGPVMLGFIGGEQSYFTANGPDVNLASRLCGEANRDELVVSAQVWHVLREFISDWKVQEGEFKLKGFVKPIAAMRISPRLVAAGNRIPCSTCGAPVVVFSTPDGTLEIKCTNGHIGDLAGRRIEGRKAA